MLNQNKAKVSFVILNQLFRLLFCQVAKKVLKWPQKTNIIQIIS